MLFILLFFKNYLHSFKLLVRWPAARVNHRPPSVVQVFSEFNVTCDVENVHSMQFTKRWVVYYIPTISFISYFKTNIYFR